MENKDGLTVKQAKDGLHKAALASGIDLPKEEQEAMGNSERDNGDQLQEAIALAEKEV